MIGFSDGSNLIFGKKEVVQLKVSDSSPLPKNRIDIMRRRINKLYSDAKKSFAHPPVR